MNPILATFTGNGGYANEAEYARSILILGKEYEVEGASVGQSVSYLRLKGISGSFNSVLFDVDFGEVCKRFSMYASKRSAFDL